MQEDLQVRPGLVIPGRELTFEASRAGGPGGQNVNKVSTRVTLRFHVEDSTVLDGDQKSLVASRLASRINRDGEIVIHADEHRSQPRNREAARARLVALLDAALRRVRPRVPTRPTRTAVRRRLEEKKRRAEIKRARGDPGDDD